MTTFDPRTVQPTHPHHVGQSYAAQQTYAAQQQFAQTSPGQQFPGLVPPPSLSKPPRKGRPLAAKIVAGLVAAGIVAGGAGAWMAFSGPSAEAAVQSTSFAGANPTTVPFGTDAPQVAAVAATGPQAGDTAGLYAATTPPACTTADFLAQLQADPNKLAAFGGVYGLGATDVPAFVNSLSPVVLRANTSVTDHPFVDGAFVPQSAVLAAGTAVLVNSYGEPTVKCYNGNPLTAGPYAADAVTITPTTQVIAQYSFTTIDNSRVVVIPGKPDPKPHKGPNPDPFLQAKADAAEQLADNARKDATAARDDATKAATAQKDAQTALTTANTTVATAQNEVLQAFLAFPPNPARVAQAQQALAQAQAAQAKAAQDLKTATDQSAAADKKAKDLEDKATADQQAADKAKQEADDSKHPHKKDTQGADKDGTATTGEGDPATAGQQGQAPAAGQNQPAPNKVATVQEPGIPTAQCPQVVADTAAVPAGCTLPTGSADAATGTTPATSGTTSTGGEKAATGSSSSQGSGSKGSSSSSSSSTSGSESAKKGGSDK